MSSMSMSNAFCIEALETRTLFSHPGGSPYAAFGNDGVLSGYAAISAEANGDVIATDVNQNTVLLHPDGSIAGEYPGWGQQGVAPAQILLPDGSDLALSGGILTRFLRSGAVDRAFGRNGNVSNFTAGTSALAFTPEQVVVDGDKIFVIGVEVYDDLGTFLRIGVERLTLSGAIDLRFGARGVAFNAADADNLDTQAAQALIGADHEIYISAELASNPLIERYTENGVADGRFTAFSAEDSFAAGLAMQYDGKILILTQLSGDHFDLFRLNHDFTPDSSFGVAGDVQVMPPGCDWTAESASPDALVVRDDGVILVSGEFDGMDSPGSCLFTLAYNPGIAAGSSAITGHFFNDVNSSGKLEKNDPPLRYWAAYVDLNNSGTYQVGDPIAYADYNGYFKIDGLAAGTYIVREVPLSGWKLTDPAGFYKVTLGKSQLVGYRDFGNHQGK